jgi:hypothetical protein
MDFRSAVGDPDSPRGNRPGAYQSPRAGNTTRGAAPHPLPRGTGGGGPPAATRVATATEPAQTRWTPAQGRGGRRPRGCPRLADQSGQSSSLRGQRGGARGSDGDRRGADAATTILGRPAAAGAAAWHERTAPTGADRHRTAGAQSVHHDDRQSGPASRHDHRGRAIPARPADSHHPDRPESDHTHHHADDRDHDEHTGRPRASHQGAVRCADAPHGAIDLPVGDQDTRAAAAGLRPVGGS